MTNGIISGYILHWKDFVFANGNVADKFLIIIGAKTGCNYLAVVATSQKHHKSFSPGCNSQEGYFHIPGGGKDFFPKDTWLLLAEPFEVDPKQLLHNTLVSKTVSNAGCLRAQLAQAIVACIRQCQDVSQQQLALL